MDQTRTTDGTQVRIKPKLGKNVLTCAGLTLLVVLSVLSLLAAVVAKSGLVRLPLFSRLYHGPTPTRLVASEPMTVDAFRVLLGSRLLSAARENVQKQTFTSSFNEKELSGVIISAVDIGLREESWKQAYSQIAIRPTDLEFFGRFERWPFKLDALVRFVPKIENGELSFALVYSELGDYEVSPKWAYRIASLLFERDLGSWKITIGDSRCHAMRLKEGTASIVCGAAP